MDWSSLLAVFPKEAVPPLIGALAGSLIGGCFVLAGSITTQYLTHRFTTQREQDKLLREKAEELTHALYQHIDWINACQRRPETACKRPG